MTKRAGPEQRRLNKVNKMTRRAIGGLDRVEDGWKGVWTVLDRGLDRASIGPYLGVEDGEVLVHDEV